MVSDLWFIFAVAKQIKYKPMYKDTIFIGQSVYVQLLNLIDRENIKKISSREGMTDTSKKWTNTPTLWLFCSLC